MTSSPGEMFETVLLTPGPLTTSRATRETMLRDFGSQDAVFIEPADFRRLLIAIREVVGEMKRVPPQEPAGSSP